MSLGPDKYFKDRRLETERELYLRSKDSPLYAQADAEEERKNAQWKEKLRFIAKELIFLIFTSLVAICVGFLLYKIFGDQVMEEVQDPENEIVSGVWNEVATFTETFWDREFLLYAFALAVLVGIYLVRAIIWSVKLLKDDLSSE